MIKGPLDAYREGWGGEGSWDKHGAKKKGTI